MSNETTPWIKATASDATGSCVEVRRHDGLVEVRDTKDAGRGPILRFRGDEWSAFLAGASKGEFDHLV